MSDFAMYSDERHQNNYLKHIDCNSNYNKNIDYDFDQYKRKKCIVN